MNKNTLSAKNSSPTIAYSPSMPSFCVKAGILLCCVMLSGCAAEKTPANPVDIPAPTHTQVLQSPKPTTSTPHPTAMLLAPSNTPAVMEQTPQAEPNSDKIYPVEDERFYYQKLDEALKKRITGMSFPEENEDCAITYDELRYVGLEYVDFDGNEHTGELIVNKKVAKEVTKIFYELYCSRYPFASIKLVDEYGEPGDDNLSMAANNTSAFNYRRVSGSKKLSRHSYGAAIDINPLFNPYIDGKRVAPPEGEAYANRDWEFAGKIDHDDLCYRLFIRNGWTWGGDWSGDKDYQHFSKDLGY